MAGFVQSLSGFSPLTRSAPSRTNGRRLLFPPRSGFPKESAPRYLIRDWDGIYGAQVHRWLARLNRAEMVAAPRLSRQNPSVERWKHLMGSIRRGLLDHIIVLGERYLPCLLPAYFACYQRAFPHMGLGHNCPEPRAVETPECG